MDVPRDGRLVFGYCFRNYVLLYFCQSIVFSTVICQWCSPTFLIKRFFSLARFTFSNTHAFSRRFFRLIAYTLRVLLSLLGRSSRFSRFNFCDSRCNPCLTYTFLCNRYPRSRLRAIRSDSRDDQSNCCGLMVLL